MKQRLIRVLVYEGSPEFIADHMLRRGVKGSRYCTGPGFEGIIREAIVGDFLETIVPLEYDHGPSDTNS